MINSQIVSTLFDDGDGVLVDLDTKRYYQLNETAMMVWDGLEKGHSIDEIANKMSSVFDVTQEHATNSVETILEKFRSLDLTGNNKTQ